MTVSRFLRVPHEVAPATAARIEAALAHTAYTPNKHAGMLASGRSNIVAAIVPNISNATFAQTVQGLSKTVQGSGLELLLASTNYSLAREEEQIRAVLGWSPSGLVVTGCRHTPAALALMVAAKASGTPVLEVWDSNPRDKRFIQIGFSHPAVGRMMARHFLQRGYRDMTYVDSGVIEDFRARERANAFVAEAAKAGARVQLITAPQSEPIAAGGDMLDEMLSSGLPRAAAFANDNLATGAYLRAVQRDISIPHQFAMLGFGDFPIASQLGDGLSTVSVAPYDIGVVCGHRLLALLNEAGARPGIRASETPAAPRPLPQPELIQRGSS